MSKALSWFLSSQPAPFVLEGNPKECSRSSIMSSALCTATVLQQGSSKPLEAKTDSADKVVIACQPGQDWLAQAIRLTHLNLGLCFLAARLACPERLASPARCPTAFVFVFLLLPWPQPRSLGASSFLTLNASGRVKPLAPRAHCFGRQRNIPYLS